MKTTCQHTELEIIRDEFKAAFNALDSVNRRQYAILWRLAESAPDVLLAAMDDHDRKVMVMLAQRAQDVQRRA